MSQKQKTLHLPDRGENIEKPEKNRRFLVRNDPDALNLVNRILDYKDHQVMALSDRDFMLLKTSVIIL